jgi:hypothetical protein
MDALREALTAGNLPQLSAFLPASYQSDITGLVQSFAGKMDPDLWNAARNLLKSAGETFAPKAAILADLIASEGEATLSAADKAKATASMGAFLKGVSAFASSDATTLDALKGGSFATVEKALGSLFPKDAFDTALLAAGAAEGDGDVRAALVKAFTISSRKTLDNGDIELTTADDDTVTLRKVEGCWIPADMADGWSEVVNSARTSISSIDFSSTEGQQQKMQMLMLLPAIQSMVQQLGTANSADELKTKAQMMFGGFLGGGMGGGMGGGALPIPGL